MAGIRKVAAIPVADIVGFYPSEARTRIALSLGCERSAAF
jgi:hypothetical protein